MVEAQADAAYAEVILEITKSGRLGRAYWIVGIVIRHGLQSTNVVAIRWRLLEGVAWARHITCLSFDSQQLPPAVLLHLIAQHTLPSIQLCCRRHTVRKYA